ncbi:hypothetical protein RJ640_015716 [Escallonia rubra]|uniref:ELMO domain-containing protein n=1 Tax=Escallonia rubra TaxID=112253 RepID=A0AA88RY31_9ASTE|nr:hypothetical protein RJ640_015716 [Escallonia rubra]
MEGKIWVRGDWNDDISNYRRKAWVGAMIRWTLDILLFLFLLFTESPLQQVEYPTVVLLGHGVNDPYYHCVYVLCEIFYSNCVLVDVANAMVGPRSWIAGIFSRSGNKRFGSEKYIDYPFSSFQQALKALWIAAYPDITLKGLISEQWKDMGWQGPNPSTDFRYCSANFMSSDACNTHAYATILSFSLAMLGYVTYKYSLSPGNNRGCGVLSLENLLFFARTYPASFHRLLFKQGGKRAAWEYPFAVAGINVTFMLIQMLDLYSAKPRSLPGVNFVQLLGEDEESFDVLYCIAFAMMDAQWLAMRASYMEFNVLPPSLSRFLSAPSISRSMVYIIAVPEVLQVTRTQLERELSLEDLHHIHDLPAYNLLYQ